MTPQERKAASEAYLRANGIGVFEGLPMVPPAEAVTVKPFDAVCKRAAAALIMTQAALEIGRQNYKDVGFFMQMLGTYGVRDVLNKTEQKLASGMFEQQDVVNVVWEYECCWALFWALGLVEDIRDASAICDCERAIHLVADAKDMAGFQAQCRLRSTDEILDMLDLYYRYHWACVQHKHIDPSCPVGSLNEEVVYERRRGLEWLISEEDDWHDISLDT